MVEHLIDQVKDAASRGARLSIHGSQSKTFYGTSSEGEPLDTRGVRGVISYEPTELVLHAKGGTKLTEIETLLAESGQMLAFEPPHFGAEATLGGCIAAGLSGPARASSGAVRDFILGVTLLDGRGDVLKFGGQVMKNVAGYDVSRLLVGSLGTLGVLLDVSLKVLPVPSRVITLRFPMSLVDALKQLQSWRNQPLPITGSAWVDDTLLIRLAGAAPAVESAAHQLQGEALEGHDVRGLWCDIREQRHSFFASDGPLWRLALPHGAPITGLGEGMIEWGGMQRWLRGAHSAFAVRECAKALGGHATLFKGADDLKQAQGVFTPLAPTAMTIHRRLKQRFDPAGIFNHARMYPEF